MSRQTPLRCDAAGPLQPPIWGESEPYNVVWHHDAMPFLNAPLSAKFPAVIGHSQHGFFCDFVVEFRPDHEHIARATIERGPLGEHPVEGVPVQDGCNGN